MFCKKCGDGTFSKDSKTFKLKDELCPVCYENQEEQDRHFVVEKLRALYQELHDEREIKKPEFWASDGEWLDRFIEGVGKLLEFESRP